MRWMGTGSVLTGRVLMLSLRGGTRGALSSKPEGTTFSLGYGGGIWRGNQNKLVHLYTKHKLHNYQ